MKIDALRSINVFANKGILFDYIFMDPPYGKDLIIKMLERVWEKKHFKQTRYYNIGA